MSRALSEDEIERKTRSLASLKRAKLKENRNLNKNEKKDDLKPIKRDVKIPETITVRELANRMAGSAGPPTAEMLAGMIPPEMAANMPAGLKGMLPPEIANRMPMPELPGFLANRPLGKEICSNLVFCVNLGL